MQCHVRSCRYPYTHVTAGHRCGRCRSWGHGQRECGRQHAVDALASHLSDTLPENLQCRRTGCTVPWLHITDAHPCEVCETPGCTCPLWKQCPVCREWNAVDLEMKVFTTAECIVCLDAKPCVLFPGCRHATVCADCTVQLS